MLRAQDPKIIPAPYNFVAFFGKLYKDVSTLDAVAPHARLAARNRSLTSNFLLNYSNAMFSFVEGKAKDSLNKIVGQLPQNKDSLASFVKPFCSDLIEAVRANLSNLEVFVQSGAKFMGEHTLVFTQDIIRRSAVFWTSLLSIMQEYASRPPVGNASFDPLSLVLCKVALEFESSLTRSVSSFSSFFHIFPTYPPSIVFSTFYIYIADTFSPNGRKAVAGDAKEAIKHSKEAGQRILNNFAEQTGQKFTMLIRTFVDTRNWMSKKEPRKVSDVWKDIMNDLTAIQKVCEQLFPDDSKPKTGSGKRVILTF